MASEGAVTVSPPAGCDVFVVDATFIIRDEIKRVVKASGYSCRGFSNAGSVLKVLSGERPRLLIVELLLGEVDGFELCDKTRMQPNLDKLDILCTSALRWGAIDLPILVQRRFGARFFAKGRPGSELAGLLREILGRPTAGQAGPQDLSSMAGRPIGSSEVAHLESLIREFEKVAVNTGNGRRQVRVPRSFPVQYRDRGQAVVCSTKNISKGGLFIESPTSPEDDEVIEIRIEVPGGTIEGRARVVHQVPEPRNPGASGFGVEFVELSEEGRSRLAELAQLEAVAGQESSPQLTGAPTRWLAFVGVHNEDILRRSSFLQRGPFQVVGFGSLDKAEPFLRKNPVEVVLIGEKAMGSSPSEALACLERSVNGKALRVLLQDSKNDLGELRTHGLCESIIDSSESPDRVLEEVSRLLGVNMRQATRVNLSAAVQVSRAAGRFEATMINIGGTGLLMRTAEPVSSGEILKLVFLLPGQGIINCQGKVVRVLPKDGLGTQVGIQFVVEADPQPIELVRRFVQSNTNFRSLFAWLKQRCFSATD